MRNSGGACIINQHSAGKIKCQPRQGFKTAAAHTCRLSAKKSFALPPVAESRLSRLDEKMQRIQHIVVFEW
jgi:hypothetical protein